jgi:hypothetical protein
VRWALLGVIATPTALAAITILALEGREVVVVRTPDGRGTRTWIADDGGAAWVEAANPERPFLRALDTRPDVEVVRGGATHRCRATAMPNPEGHRRVRELLARKYGWADRWIGMLADTSRSVGIRLACD